MLLLQRWTDEDERSVWSKPEYGWPNDDRGAAECKQPQPGEADARAVQVPGVPGGDRGWEPSGTATQP